MLSGVLGVIESISSYIMSIWYHLSPYSEILNKRPKISPHPPPPPLQIPFIEQTVFVM